MKAVELAISGCKQVYEVQREALKKKYGMVPEGSESEEEEAEEEAEPETPSEEPEEHAEDEE